MIVEKIKSFKDFNTWKFFPKTEILFLKQIFKTNPFVFFLLKCSYENIGVYYKTNNIFSEN